MQQSPNLVKRMFFRIWCIINAARNIILNLVFFTLVIGFIAILTSSDERISVPDNTALVLNLKGDLVEQKRFVDPMNLLINDPFGRLEENPEVLISDIVDVIENAKTDERVSLLVLHLQRLERAGLSKLQTIGKALTDFKTSGKKIVALGGMYSQSQYYLASYADDIWLNNKGYLMLDGFCRYQLYFKSALEKLSISQHVFRVGTFKSAVEPYLRDDMSEEAKTANQLWLNDLWSQYKEDVAQQRELNVSDFDETTEALVTKFKAANGSFAEYALDNGWVDVLKSRQQMRDELIAVVGKNDEGDSFNQIGFKDYLKAITPPIPVELPGDKIGIIVAKGEILDGSQLPGLVGGDSTARLLREARYDKDIKAVVLRVDSPGGSAYASEIIRQEIDLLQAAGKPVIASMGTVAASGGYWISSSADKIYAAPTTITGSIGIYGMFMTFENSLSKLGVYTDGVGTTELAGFGVTRPLTDGMADVFQLNIDRGYQDFISLVATHRNMTLEQVDAIAQGRVWSGLKAKELGLVDELGDLQAAVNAAAELAELEQFHTKVIEKELSPQDKFLQNLVGSASVLFNRPLERSTGPASQFMQKLHDEITRFDNFNDPQGIYSFCLTCDTF